MRTIVLGDIIREIVEKTTINNQYPVLTSSQSGLVSQGEYFNKQIASQDNTGYKIIRKGQFTYRAMSDTGRFYINQSPYEIGIVSPAYPVFEIIEDGHVLPEYIATYFRSDPFQNAIALQSTGSTRVSLKLGKIKDISIDIPSVSEQEEILEIINEVESLIGSRREQLAKLDELVKSRFIELFGAGKYPIVKAADVCGFITKGTTPPTGEITEKYEIGMIPYLKVYNLSFSGELLFDSMPQYIPAETHNKQLARSKVVPNDVLMNIVGPPLGKFSLVTDEFSEWNINQAIAIFRAKDRVLPRYLLAALMQPDVLRPFLEQAVGIRQLNLSLEQCRNLEFPLPPIEEQKAFVKFSEQTDKSKLAIQESLAELETLKKALMQKYFG